MKRTLLRLTLLTGLVAPTIALIGCQPTSPQVDEKRQNGTKVDIEIGGKKSPNIDIEVDTEKRKAE